jgi:hypothetical protein
MDLGMNSDRCVQWLTEAHEQLGHRCGDRRLELTLVCAQQRRDGGSESGYRIGYGLIEPLP